MSLPSETRDHYVRIVDSILAASDLNTISAKRIRKGLQTAVDYDITPHKNAITALILQRFDIFTAKEAAENAATSSAKTNGATNSNGKRASPSDSSSAASPSPKKRKPGQSVEETDAAYAARLQAEENGRARSTRGAGTKRKAPSKKEKRKKKKSKTVVGSDDDSDAGTPEEKVIKNTGFHKPMALSPPLAELLGQSTLSRPQTVKKIWEYIKANDLQDPSDKRQIRCDEPMRNIFKQDRVHMFTMNKILNQNLYAADE